MSQNFVNVSFLMSPKWEWTFAFMILNRPFLWLNITKAPRASPSYKKDDYSKIFYVLKDKNSIARNRQFYNLVKRVKLYTFQSARDLLARTSPSWDPDLSNGVNTKIVSKTRTHMTTPSHKHRIWDVTIIFTKFLSPYILQKSPLFLHRSNYDFVKKMVTFVKIMVTFVKIMVTFIKIMVTFVKKMVTFKMSPFWYTLDQMVQI